MMKKIVPEDVGEYSRYILGRARFFVTRARQYELAPYHISPRQAYILFLLYNRPDHNIALRELAWQTDRKINTLSVNMTKMEKEGFVHKIRNTPGSNNISYILTEKGQNTYLNCKREESVKAIMSVLTSEEHQQLITMLEKITQEAEKYNLKKMRRK